MKTLIESHQQMKSRHSNEIGNIKGLFWAFSNSQLDEGLLKTNSTVKDIVSIGAGGYIRRDELQAFKDLLERHATERKERLKDQKILFDSLVYELGNHEYCITYNPQDALDALGLSREDVDETLLNRACRESLK